VEHDMAKKIITRSRTGPSAINFHIQNIYRKLKDRGFKKASRVGNTPTERGITQFVP